MSRRGFDRCFRADMVVPAMQCLISRRVEQARSLLEQGPGNIEQPATEVGFDTAALLRTTSRGPWHHAGAIPAAVDCQALQQADLKPVLISLDFYLE